MRHKTRILGLSPPARHSNELDHLSEPIAHPVGAGTFPRGLRASSWGDLSQGSRTSNAWKMGTRVGRNFSLHWAPALHKHPLPPTLLDPPFPSLSSMLSLPPAPAPQPLDFSPATPPTSHLLLDLSRVANLPTINNFILLKKLQNISKCMHRKGKSTVCVILDWMCSRFRSAE